MSTLQDVIDYVSENLGDLIDEIDQCKSAWRNNRVVEMTNEMVMPFPAKVVGEVLSDALGDGFEVILHDADKRLYMVTW